MTTDPAGFIDSVNLYQYVLNNPFRYIDPDGQMAFVIPLLLWGTEIILPTLSAAIVPVIYGTALAATAYAGYKTIQIINKNTEIYAPDRRLPLTEDGIPIPDTDAPHTQLGKKGSKRRPGEKYPQAREFDEKGNPVKTIDFTDHGESLIHTNPHEHLCEPNPTGGTFQRGNPKPLENWQY